MVETWFQRVLQNKIEEEIQTRAASIASGVCTDHAAYRYHCGVIDGLRMGLEKAREIEQEQT